MGRVIALRAVGCFALCPSSRSGGSRASPSRPRDATFNGQGWVTSDGAAGGAGDDSANGPALDAAGRISVGGASGILVTGHGGGSGGNMDTAIWRFNDDGSLDPTFGGRGWVLHDGAAGGRDRDEGKAITLDRWGRIVAAGSSVNDLGDPDRVVWRFRP